MVEQRMVQTKPKAGAPESTKISKDMHVLQTQDQRGGLLETRVIGCPVGARVGDIEENPLASREKSPEKCQVIPLSPTEVFPCG